MRLFSLTKEIAIDLGTANTVIIHNDKIVIDEPSIVALDRRTDKLLAVGREAQLMQGKEPEGIRTERPLRKGVIADFNAAELAAAFVRSSFFLLRSLRHWVLDSLHIVLMVVTDLNRCGIAAVDNLARAFLRYKCTFQYIDCQSHFVLCSGSYSRYSPDNLMICLNICSVIISRYKFYILIKCILDSYV